MAWLATPRRLSMSIVLRNEPKSTSGESLDPADWRDLRAQGHRMLDDMFDYLEHIRDRPVWQPIPDDVRRRFDAPVPTAPSELAEVHESFMRDILPFSGC